VLRLLEFLAVRNDQGRPVAVDQRRAMILAAAETIGLEQERRVIGQHARSLRNHPGDLRGGRDRSRITRNPDQRPSRHRDRGQRHQCRPDSEPPPAGLWRGRCPIDRQSHRERKPRGQETSVVVVELLRRQEHRRDRDRRADGEQLQRL
jgi:hypothetical protein